MARKDCIDPEVMVEIMKIIGTKSEDFYELINTYLESIVKFKRVPTLVDPEEYDNIVRTVCSLNRSLNIDVDEDNIDSDLEGYLNALKPQ